MGRGCVYRLCDRARYGARRRRSVSLAALASARHRGHYARVRLVGLSFAVAGVLALGTSGCTEDEASRENCDAGAKCAPWSVVNSNRLLTICMTGVPKESTVGAVVDSAATIGLSGQHTPTVAHAAMVDGEVVQGFYILTPSDPTCSQPCLLYTSPSPRDS